MTHHDPLDNKRKEGGDEPDVQAVSSDLGLIATALSSSSIQLTYLCDWVLSPQYKVYRDGELVYTGTSTTYTDIELYEGTIYTYRVEAYQLVDLSSLLLVGVQTVYAATNTTVDVRCSYSVPTAVRLLYYTFGYEVSKYVVKRGGTVIGEGVSESYVDYGLWSNWEYTYTVEAYARIFLVGSTSLTIRTRAPIIDAGIQHSILLKGDKVWTWGNNGNGQLGDGTINNVKTTPIQVPGLSKIVAVAAGGGHSMALTEEGRVWVWGYNGLGQLGYPDPADKMDKPTPFCIDSLSDVMAISGGHDHSLVLKRDGTVWAWGNNFYGQLGFPTAPNETVPKPTQVVFPEQVRLIAIDAGMGHSMAIDEFGNVWTWGSNTHGQLGDGSKINRKSPVKLPGLTDAVAVVGGPHHSLVLRADGTVWGFGSNNSGQLGSDPSVAEMLTPTQVPGLSNVIRIATGNYNSANNFHSIALKADGTAWTFGSNSNGQLGIGSPAGYYGPVQISALDRVREIAGGGKHSLVLGGDWAFYGFGWNSSGQLGDGTVTDRFSAVTVKVKFPAV